MRRRAALLCTLALWIAAAVPAAARGPSRTDTIWLAPEFASFDVRSIAMFPAFTFDGSVEARHTAETALGQALRGTGYRWLSSLVTRDQVTRDGGDSLFKALTQDVLKQGRVDSLSAPRLSRATRTRALFTVRVDRFEKLEMEFDQSGKPTTTVQLTAALVDSTGRLLWSASGSETAEGPYHDANASALGVQASGLNNTPVTGQGGAPSYAETVNRLMARWLPNFPVRATAAAAPDSATAH